MFTDINWHFPYSLSSSTSIRLQKGTTAVFFSTQGFPNLSPGHKGWKRLLPALWSSQTCRAMMVVMQMNSRRWKLGSALGFLPSIKPLLMPPLTDMRLCVAASGREYQFLCGMVKSCCCWNDSNFFSCFFFHYCGKEQMGFLCSCNTQQY